jgi:DNA-binding winged helix-turn-helix (wHTH) protein
MHSVIITPYNLQSKIYQSALHRENIKSINYSPKSIGAIRINTDAILIPHPLQVPEWKEIKKFLEIINKNIPVIIVGITQNRIFHDLAWDGLLHRCIFIDESISLDKTIELIREIICKNNEKLSSLNQISINNCILNPENRTLKYKNKKIQLTKKEFHLMKLLMQNVGRVLSHERIIDYVWDRRDYVARNTIEVYISRLRKKLKCKNPIASIETIPCLGYKLVID